MFKSNETKVALPAIIIFWYFYSLQWTSLQNRKTETTELILQYFSILKYGYLHDRVITNSYKFQHTWRNSSYNTSSVTFSDKLPHQTVLSSSILQPNRQAIYDLYLLRIILAQQLTSYLRDLINLVQRSKTWYILYSFFLKPTKQLQPQSWWQVQHISLLLYMPRLVCRVARLVVFADYNRC
jgi:hypothetical protein